MGQVFIHTSETLDGDFKAGLFQHFAPNTGLERFLEFEDSPGRLPMTVVVPLDDQNPVVIADHDACNADRVLRCGCHARLLLCAPLQS
ncbi:hypothetical protein A5763_12665 [Mycolicibacterium fortuitum]|nr:hypothetical protein A5763_12665 [Mycolicibacterium fortuitum]